LITCRYGGLGKNFQATSYVETSSTPALPSTNTATEEKAVEVDIERRGKHEVTKNVKKGDEVCWEFTTPNNDIGFSLRFQSASNVPPVVTNIVDDTTLNTNETGEVIVPFSRHTDLVGSYKAEKEDGVVVITLDNTYSLLTKKKVFYRVYVINPQ